MAKILCVETSTTNCSVAIAVDGKVNMLLEDLSKQYSHAESLHVFIEKALKNAHISKEDIEAVAISKGPGSYTGLRIGVSAAKGLCYALDIPLIAISTLEAFSRQINIRTEFVIPMLDARRMEVYTAVFDKNFEEIEEVQAKILGETSFEKYLSAGKVVFFGNANEKAKTILVHPNAVFVENLLPSAKDMCLMAEEKFQEKEFENVAYFEPYYLKDFVS